MNKPKMQSVNIRRRRFGEVVNKNPDNEKSFYPLKNPRKSVYARVYNI